MPDNAQGAAPHWSYEGATGPGQWGALHKDWACCSECTKQSPIDLSRSLPENSNLPALGISYQPTPLNVVNNGHTIQVDIAPGSTLTVGQATYTLLQFHFHCRCEHTLEGDVFAMEGHLVHKSASDQLAVLGMWIKQGAANSLAALWDGLPATSGQRIQNADVTLNPAALLPSSLAYFHYQGSLTTPPCSEGVQWYMLREPIELSAAQIAAYSALYSNNFRPVQPLNDRTVVYRP